MKNHDSSFAFFHFSGSHSEVGRQHGEALAERIGVHLARVSRRLAAHGHTREEAEALALRYRPAVREASPGLDDEIVGLADGAGIELGSAYLLQLRAEVFAALTGRHGDDLECTTFAVQPKRSHGHGLIGQNADLPEMYLDLLNIVRISVDGEPELLIVTPAGQISYIGINDRGLGVFGNYLHSGRWRIGYPRYLYSRFMLTQTSTAEALTALRGLTRSSSRNLLIMDAAGDAIDVENTVDEIDVLHPVDGLLAHSNHYVSERLAHHEQTSWLENSVIRLNRVQELLVVTDALDARSMAVILRDRDDPRNALSIHPEDDGVDDGTGSRNMTVTSVIAEPALGRIWVSAGPPSRAGYRSYGFGEQPGAATIDLVEEMGSAG